MSASVASASRPASAGAMTRRKVDDRLRQLVDRIAHEKHRGLVLLVGDRGRDQIVNLHHMISRATHSAKLNVLWCMKEDPDFGSTGRKQQERRARLEVKGGMATEATKEAFQTFLAQTQIRFCKYKETHKVLGQTFGMAVLQDFEAMTPNTLARTIETVKGGGLIVVMFRSMRALRQLHTMAMDVHARYRTEAQQEVVPRFNERFLLSLVDCGTALCVDDELHVLPITQSMAAATGATTAAQSRLAAAEADAELVLQGRLRHEAELAALKEKLKPSAAVGPLVQACQTMDQAKTVLSLMQAVAEKALDATCVVTAGRGRGKSAALGMAAAGAVAQGYSNILCTAPSPENLQTFFEFVLRGLTDLGYKERVDYEAMQSTTEEFAKCIIRVNIFRDHRQTVQFVSATDTHLFAQAELAIIDEAAALPLTLVQKMMGPYLIFLSSTVSGYEGTGRSLSMKLVADLRRRAGKGGPDGRTLREVSMSDPIRYGPKDPVERWLHRLLCLDATAEDAAPLQRSPHPNTCELYYVDRDALFSYHPLAEQLLQRAQALLVAAHYKNQPNDLQLLSDAPGHHLFVLCAASLEGDAAADKAVPEIYCVIHACEEGHVSAAAVKHNLSRGLRPSGDLIPYTLSQAYLEEGFAKLAGMRIVRIATHPDLQRGGYGSRAVQLLQQYYRGEISLTPAEAPAARAKAQPAAAAATASKQRDNSDEEEGEEEEEVAAAPQRKKAAASSANLLVPLVARPYEALDYLGVSFGVTTPLFNFWKRAVFLPLYLRQAANELTGEHSCIMVHPMGVELQLLQRAFHTRFLRLLSMPFRALPTELALSMIAGADMNNAQTLAAATTRGDDGVARVAGIRQATADDIHALFTPADLTRLRLAATTFVEGGNVLDLMPRLAELYFSQRLFLQPDGSEGVVLTYAQAAVLLAIGLQCQTLEALGRQEAFAGVAIQQLRAFLQKGVARVVEHLHTVQRAGLSAAPVKRARARAADGEGDDDSNGEANADELQREILDEAGNVVGLSVTRRVRKEVESDRTLLRDARTAVVGGGHGKEVFKDQQHAFKRVKKDTKGKRRK